MNWLWLATAAFWVAFATSPALSAGAVSGADGPASAAVRVVDSDDVDLMKLPALEPSVVARAWASSGPSLRSRAIAARRRSIQLGVGNLDAASRALTAPAAGAGLPEAILAARLAPDLPAAHVALARALWSEGQRVEAAGQLVAGLRSTVSNLDALFWGASSWLVLTTFVLAGGALVFIIAAALVAFPRAAHDLGDLISKHMPAFARTALLASVALLPVLFGEGIIGFTVVMFGVAILYSDSGDRLALVLAALLAIVALGPLAQVAGRSLSAPASDPVALAAHAVIRERTTAADLEILSEAEGRDLVAAHALALYARRQGAVDSATARYERLLARQSNDPIVMTNLANLYFERGDLDRAIDLYERASSSLESPILMFDLSQAYARAFRMEETEAVLRRAQSLGPELFSELSRAEDSNLVAGVPFPVSLLRDRMIAAASGEAFAREIVAPIAPGLLARGWRFLAGAFAAAALLGTFLGTRFDRASSCGRCGRRICARCDGTVWSAETCEACHRLFSRPETTDLSLRNARLAVLRRREERIDRAATAAALLVPGAAGFLARRADLALCGMLFCGWAVAALGWRAGVIPDPLSLDFLGSLVFATSGVVALLAHFAIARFGLAARKRA